MNNTPDTKTPFNLAAGQLLVASPIFEGNPDFGRSVILLLQKDNETNGSWGVDLTRKEAQWGCVYFIGGTMGIDSRAGNCLTQVFDKENGRDLPLVTGTDMSFYSTLSHKKPIFTSDDHAPVREHTFVGYIGWDAGQLENEVANDFWRIVPATKELVFETEPSDLWKNCAQKTGFVPAL